MIKQALAGLGLDVFAVIGLVLFVATFVGITIWTLSRSRSQIDRWSSLPLDDSKDPVEPRDNDSMSLSVVTGAPSANSGSCGKCSNCTCIATPLTNILSN